MINFDQGDLGRPCTSFKLNLQGAEFSKGWGSGAKVILQNFSGSISKGVAVPNWVQVWSCWGERWG